jgi:DNA-directed RNA polymerase specialized sigma24 family protein
MFDKDAPSSRRVFAALAQDGVRAQLYRYAIWRTGDADDAQDLVADALVLVCDPAKKKTWDPAGGKSFFRHMRGLLDDLAVVGTRAGPGRFEINETDLIHKTGDPHAFPEPADEREPADAALARHGEHGWLRGLGDKLLERLRGRDDAAVAVYHAASLHEEAADQAEHLGIPVEEVYEAHRRLRYHAAILKKEWERAEAARMSPVGRRTKQKEKEKEDPS